MKFAAQTEVPVEKSRAEIEGTVRKYGASEFMSGWMSDKAIVGFKMREKLLRFVLPLPDPKDKKFTTYMRGMNKWTRSEEVAQGMWEQACRQRWRALLLAIKAKLEAVECGISTFESEFMAHIVLPTGLTIGETVLPQLPEAFERGGPMPLLLPPGNGKAK